MRYGKNFLALFCPFKILVVIWFHLQLKKDIKFFCQIILLCYHKAKEKKMAKFFKCSICGNIITKIEDSGVSVFCCGQKMEELVANTTDAAQEKHVPVVQTNGNTVTVNVGSVAHPMSEEHNISFIALETNLGLQIKKLSPLSTPNASFSLANDEKVENVYAYCNLHGLWKN